MTEFPVTLENTFCSAMHNFSTLLAKEFLGFMLNQSILSLLQFNKR